MKRIMVRASMVIAITALGGFLAMADSGRYGGRNNDRYGWGRGEREEDRDDDRNGCKPPTVTCPVGQHAKGTTCVCDTSNATPKANGACTTG
jgi:hypothetical protein